MIRRVVLASALSLAALPAVAGAGFDLPHLVFPPTNTTTSTSNGK